MLAVYIYINDRQILKKTAVNVSKHFGIKYGKGRQKYETDCQKIITHTFENGAIKLATKLLELEQRRKERCQKFSQ